VAIARAGWRLSQVGRSSRHLVFLDEAGVRTDLTRTHGRAPRGVRVRESVPHARWKTVTVISAIRSRGVAASLAFEGACDGPAFAPFAERVLAPTLRPGDVVVLDNLGAHKDASAARAIHAAGADLRFLPPYSPDLNPIERMWSKVKGQLRSTAARSTEAIWDALGPALASINSQDCQHWFRGCGYNTRN
jgi:transposase